MSKVRRSTARDEHGLAVTCPASRHAQLIAEELIKRGSCAQLEDEGKHAGESILSAVHSLYAARAEIIRLTAEVKRHRMTPGERRISALAADFMSALAADFMSDPGIGPDPLSMSDEINALRGYLDRTKPKEPSNG